MNLSKKHFFGLLISYLLLVVIVPDAIALGGRTAPRSKITDHDGHDITTQEECEDNGGCWYGEAGCFVCGSDEITVYEPAEETGTGTATHQGTRTDVSSTSTRKGGGGTTSVIKDPTGVTAQVESNEAELEKLESDCEELFNQVQAISNFSTCDEQPTMEDVCAQFSNCMFLEKGTTSECIANSICGCYGDIAAAEAQKTDRISTIAKNQAMSSRDMVKATLDAMKAAGVISDKTHQEYTTDYVAYLVDMVGGLDSQARADRYSMIQDLCTTGAVMRYGSMLNSGSGSSSHSTHQQPSTSGRDRN